MESRPAQERAEDTESPSGPGFVHLHVHTEYSLLDGCIQVPKLIKALEDMGAKACAITDHDAMHGVVEYSLSCQKKGINGIIGCELRVETFSIDLGTPSSHLVLLAETNEGYSNLVKLCSYLATSHDGKEPAPESGLPIEVLKKHASGLICLTSCLKGELAQLAIAQRETCGVRYLETLIDTFGANNVFVELADNGLPEQKAIFPTLSAWAGKLGLGTVGTGDVHYLNGSDRRIHLSLLAIKHKLKRDDVRSLDHENYDFSLATPEEMLARFQDYPEAAANTVAIAARCKVTLTTGIFYMPDYRESEQETADECLARLSWEGLEARRPAIELSHGENFNSELWDDYKKRLEYELSIIEQMKFAGYFLIVQDFIKWAKAQDIPVGPGRGSAAGSLVTYCLSITNIDPIRFNLLFERFLNPERISMPDIDTDFCMDRRQEVLDYCYRKYGEANVCQIVTFGRMMAKNALKNMARISGWSFNDSNDFAKLIPETPGITLAKSLEEVEELRGRLDRDERARELWDDAVAVEGTLSSLGIHAAGVIISDRPLTELCPVMESEGQILTQVEHKYAEKIGLIKFDFLGLKTLTTIKKALAHIKKLTGDDLDIDTVELEDPKVYEMISTACVTGVFQLESNGMRKLISELKPSCFSDIVAVLALFRPGPLGSGMVEDFVLRKHGKKEVEYPLPQLEDILSDTYGVIVFQEQVQKIAAVLANYSLGEADLLRRAMGKKDLSEMERQKTRFVSGAESNGIEGSVASEIFDLMAKFAEYGFNKSHTAAYGWVTYQTAYLKTYYPVCFMAAAMTCDLGDTDKVVNYIKDCRRMGVPINPPNINESSYEFQVTQGGRILYGLGAIKGVGQAIVEEIVAERTRGGPFTSCPEFIARVGARKLNKKLLESLIKAGAFDSLERNRLQLISNLDRWVRAVAREQERVSIVGAGLFDDVGSEDDKISSLLVGIQVEQTPFWSRAAELEQEKSVLGTYLTDHPARIFESDFRTFRACKLSDIARVADLQDPATSGRPEGATYVPPKTLRLVGILSGFQERRTRDNEKFAMIKIEDASAEVEISIFPQQYAALDFSFQPGEALWVNCNVRNGIEKGSVRLSCKEIGRLSDLMKDKRRLIRVELLQAKDWVERPQNLDDFLNYLGQANGKGNTGVEVHIRMPEDRLQIRAGLKNNSLEDSTDILAKLDEKWPKLLSAEAIYLPDPQSQVTRDA